MASTAYKTTSRAMQTCIELADHNPQYSSSSRVYKDEMGDKPRSCEKDTQQGYITKATGRTSQHGRLRCDPHGKDLSLLDASS